MTDVTAVPSESDRGTRSKSRILEAAREEFAASGFGGGRIERISARAGVNKERIYAYFTDKRTLFTATVANAVQEVGRTVTGEAESLEDYAGQLFDFIADHPDTLRLLNWARLETEQTSEPLEDLPRPEDAVARWQSAGLVAPQWNPHDLVVFIWGLCEACHVPPFRATGPDAPSIEQRRRALVTYVAGLLAQRSDLPGT